MCVTPSAPRCLVLRRVSPFPPPPPRPWRALPAMRALREMPLVQALVGEGLQLNTRYTSTRPDDRSWMSLLLRLIHRVIAGQLLRFDLQATAQADRHFRLA